MAVAAAAVAVGSVQYFFPPAPKAVEKKDDEVAAANAKVEAEAAAKAEAAKKAAEYAAAEKALYEQDGPAAEEVAAPAAPEATAVAEEKVAVVEKEDEDEDEAPVVPAAVKFVVCFDFDKCLMSDHWWGRYVHEPRIKLANRPTNEHAYPKTPRLFRLLFFFFSLPPYLFWMIFFLFFFFFLSLPPP